MFVTVMLCLLSFSRISGKGNTMPFEFSSFLQERDTLDQDTTKNDTIPKPAPEEEFGIFDDPPQSEPRLFDFKDREGDPFSNRTSPSPFNLKDPSGVNVEAEIDTSMNYTIFEKIGDLDYRPISEMSFDEYNEYQEKKLIKDYWKERSLGLDGESAVSGRSLIPPLYVSPVFDRIFGGSYVDIRPNGFVNLNFGGRFQRTDNPAIPIQQQRNAGFEFDQQMSMNVVGQIGDKMAVTANFDNNNTFDFQNNLKVEYTGYEEDIIKKIEIGNVSLPLNNSLITGAQSLFGVKTQLQFGKLYVTTVLSRQQGRNEVISIESGFQGREFEVRGSDYDENKHFFLGHFFRDNYEQWLSSIPQVTSGVNITRVEVYLMNRTNNTETLRNFVSFMDLGEGQRIHRPANTSISPAQGNVPNSNSANNLWETLRNTSGIRATNNTSSIVESQLGLEKGIDFEQINGARRLDEKEFVVNRQLGYISLNRRLQNDEVLAVSFEYTYNGQQYKVGELTEDYQNRPEDEAIILKMLRPSNINVRIPTWDLMMKNIYNLNASQISEEGFQLRIIYRDDRTGIDNPSLHEGANTKDRPLIELLGLDRLNQNGDPQRDGNFDFVEGITIETRNGNIIFPVLEPFGRTLRNQFLENERALINRYVYDTLYRTTKADAELITTFNKFFINGRFMSGSAAEIQLPGINISPGSVQVVAGNTPLTEGLDYTVDYNLGKVRILNDGVMNSGKRINISYEKADMFNFQTRWLSGARFDYVLSDELNIGATLLHMNERPGGITRFQVGDEPTRNTKYGFDVSYNKESRFLTKMVDAIPLIQTKEPSNINFHGEFAQLLPGTSNIIGGEGTSYIDDFEAAAIPFALGGSTPHTTWKLASTPRTPDDRFDLRRATGDELSYGYRRAKNAWYVIDNIFYRDRSPNKPQNLTDEDMSNHYIRAVSPQEIYTQRDREVLQLNEPLFEFAYFPSERGMYNYNPNLTPDGRLPNPEQNWAGISRAITSEVDFDKNNIEYIEFWLLDPFIPGPRGAVLDGVENTNNTTGGKLYFNLGSISEDLIPDGRHGFENGLPASGGGEGTEETAWGRVTRQQFLTDAFDNDPAARDNQDIGLDGLTSEEEAEFFSDYLSALNLNPDALARVQSDPAGDDFQYYLGEELDDQDIKILERYKNFNGMENNSPAQTGTSGLQGFVPAGSNLPDNEDLNNDNSISDTENYYEYEIDLRPGELEVGRQHIVDAVTGLNGEATWYLFRIPVRSPDRVQGNIEGFKSIRFVRMYLTQFRQPVVLRMAKFQMVGSQWRKFPETLYEKGFNEIPEDSDPNFTIGVINVEENSQGGPDRSPYVIPPGIERDRDNSSAIFRRQNEQSLLLCLEDLQNRDARAVYKNTTLDLINYGEIRMFFHADGENIQDDEVTGFLRLGTDFTQNYYEIEVPLKITPFGTSVPEEVWPEENEIKLKLDELFALKAARDRTGANLTLPFSAPSENGQYRLTIEGRPDISDVQNIMIGIRNPDTPDEAPKSVCVWANELRVTDFETTAGWAANARLNTKLADLMNVTASTRYTTFGFGDVQSRIAERTREETTEFDVSANIRLDKFTPESFGLRVPMFISYEAMRVRPRWDPLDPDIPLSASVLSFPSQDERDAYSRLVEDRMVRRSINFSNVGKDKTKEDAVSRIYDVENLTFNYAFSDVNRSNINTASYELRSYRGGLAYNFSPDVAPIEPLKNVGFLDNPYTKLLHDFNFSVLPSNISVRGDMDRSFIRTQFRSDNLSTDGIEPNFEKYFVFNRMYNMRWNLTKGLNIDYNARVNAVIDEPFGDIDTRSARDSIMTNIRNFGRMRTFDQAITANYRLPLDKFAFTDWLNADARYTMGYNWRAGAIGQSDTLGNILQNNREIGGTGKLDMVRLYNKVKFLKEINTPPRRASRARTTTPTRRSSKEEEEEEKPSLSDNKFLKNFFRTLMSLRSINVNYSVREGTVLPGFRPRPFLFGLDSNFNAPGWAFLLGDQDPDIRWRAAENGWLARSPFQTNPFTQSRMEDISIRAVIEPFRDLKIQVDAKRTETSNYQEIFRVDTTDGFNDFRSLTPNRSGSYNITFLMINTSFIQGRSDNSHPLFDNFESYRAVIRDRLNEVNPSGEYNLNAQDVLIPSFLAAYTGQDPNEIKLNPFPKIPLPNWRVDYAGLSKIAALKDIFSSINLLHGYTSVFSVNNYSNSLNYRDNLELTNSITSYPLASQLNDEGNLIPLYIMNQVVLSERFAPLIGVNLRTKSRINTRIEYKRERNLALNFSNSQITELNSGDVTVDFGYTKTGLTMPFKWQGRTIGLDNDITFRMSLTVRDTETIQRKIEEVATITAGNLNFQVRPTIDYVVNDRLNVMLYFERSINNPKISNSFPRFTTAFGTQVRFSLSQ